MDWLRGEAAPYTGLCSYGSTPLPGTKRVSDSLVFGCETSFLSSCVCTFDRQLVALFGDAVGPLKGLSRKKWFPRRALQFLSQPVLCSHPLFASWSTQTPASPPTATAVTPCNCLPFPQARMLCTAPNCEPERVFLSSAGWKARYFIAATRKMTNTELLSLALMRASIRRESLAPPPFRAWHLKMRVQW